MAVPNSYQRKFSVNNIEFTHYYAQDAHGTITQSFYVNNLLVETPREFYQSVAKAVGDAEFYIAMACGLHKVTSGYKN